MTEPLSLDVSSLIAAAAPPVASTSPLPSASPAPTAATSVLFRQKDRSKRERHLRRSTLAFEAAEQQADDGEQQRQQQQLRTAGRQSMPAAQQSLPEERKDHEEETKTAGDDDSGDALQQRLARLRQDRLRQRSGVGRRGRELTLPAATSSAGRSSAAVSSVGSVRRGLRDIAVGDDFDTGRSSSVPADSGAAGGYSKEAMQQLRHNAIHISAAAAYSHTDNAAMQLEGQDEEPEEGEEAEASSDRSLIAAAKLQRARRRAMAELGQDFIPIRREQTAPARTSSRRSEGPENGADDDDDGVTVQRLVLRDAIVLDGEEEDEEGKSGQEAQPVRHSVRFGRVYVAGDESDAHGTLLREDDTDDVVDVSGDSREVKDADRLLFGDDGREGRRLSTRKEIQGSLKQQQTAEEEMDSELEEWEEEQLRHGGVRLVVSSKADSSKRHQQRPSPPAPALSAQQSLQSLSVSGLQSSLQSHLSSLRQTHAASVQQLASLGSRLSRKREEELQLHRAAEEAEERLLFHREMRDWVETLLSMLAEKVADVDEAWEEMRRMRRRQGGDRQDRWQLYRRDEKDELQAELAGGIGQQAATQQQQQQQEVQEVDEFGRDLSYVREVGKDRRDDVRRRVRQLLQEQRKQNRSAAAPAAGRDEELYAASAGWDGEGWDSEETEYYEQEEGAASTFSSALSSFLQDVGGILQDVEAEWRGLPAVVGQLQHWRQRAPHSFHDAFIALSLPKLLAPYTRIDCMLSHHALLPPLLSSPPAYSSPFTLSSFTWYRTLERYCFAAQTQASGGEEEDAHLIPKLLLSVLSPLLQDVLRYEWDVRSERQTRRMLQVLQQLTAHTAAEGERGDKLRQELEDAVSARLQQELEDSADVPAAGHPVSPGYATQREAVRTVKLLWTLSLCEGVGEAGTARSMLAVQRRRVEQLRQLVPHASAVQTLVLAVLYRTQSVM